MRTITLRAYIWSSCLIASLGWPAAICAQGSLTPPAGAPAPTMKTLDQVEARTMVNAANTPGDSANTFIIHLPGSYYLIGNITGAAGKHGISIQADDVTLDLNGFELISGGTGTVRGIDVPAAQTGMCIRNGTVRGWTGDGIHGQAALMLAEHLHLTNNTGATGLAVGNGSIVRDCVAAGNSSGTGFFCPDRTQISNCIATTNGFGFDCTSYVSILDCTASRNTATGIRAQNNCNIVRCSVTRGGSDGILAWQGSTISNCIASANFLSGISIVSGAGGTVSNNSANGNGGTGISVSTIGCLVTGNSCAQNGQFGIDVGLDGNRVEGNSCMSNAQAGFYAGFGGNGAPGSLFIRNIAAHNTPNFSVDPQNTVGPIVTMTGGTITSTNPWANFAY